MNRNIEVPFNPNPLIPHLILAQPFQNSMTSAGFILSLTPDNVRSIAGPLLIGYMLNWALWGVLSVQVYIYYLAFPNDRTHSKVLVYGLFMIETFQSLFMGRDMFFTFAIGFNNLAELTNLNYSWLTMPILGGFAALVVQCFYAYRILVLSRSKVVPGIILVLSLMQCSGAFMDGILAKQVASVLKLTTPLQIVGHILWDGSSAACDVFIAVYMCFFLSNLGPTSKSTQATLTRVINVTLSTGSLTAAVAILDLVLFLADYRRGTLFVAPCAVLGKLYSNSMMVLLNSRMEIDGGRNATDTTDVVLDSNVFKTTTGVARETGEITFQMQNVEGTEPIIQTV